MERTPHGYHDAARIAHDLATAGFTGTPDTEAVAFTSRAASPHIAALAYCHGTPLRGEIEASAFAVTATEAHRHIGKG